MCQAFPLHPGSRSCPQNVWADVSFGLPSLQPFLMESAAARSAPEERLISKGVSRPAIVQTFPDMNVTFHPISAAGMAEMPAKPKKGEHSLW